MDHDDAQLGTEPGTKVASYTGETREIEAGLDAVGDAPVTVSIEIARFELSLAEVGRLAEGEIVQSGAKLGDAVRLRVGTRVLAVGELMDVDGEVGVRITQLRE